MDEDNIVTSECKNACVEYKNEHSECGTCGQYKDIIDKMVFSYSRLTSFEHCKYGFYLNYIVNDDSQYLSEGNFYAEVGSFVHEILAMIFEGKMTPDEASQYYVDNFYNNVFYTTKQSIMDNTFEKCANYFAEVDFSWLNNYEILGVEMQTKFQIEGYDFVGYIDLLVRDKRDGRIVIIDNKSSEYPFRNDGKVKAKAKENFEKYKKQMYLYAYGVKQIYNELPKTLVWNHFKEGGRFATIPFVESEYNEAVKWFVDTIHDIEKEENYEPNHQYFFCNNLCNFRNSCEFAKEGQ